MTSDHPERAIFLAYAPAQGRGALAALLALDDALAALLRSTREPVLGQMRLAWWRDSLAKLDEAPPPAEPVLQAVAVEVLPRGVTGSEIAALVDGWEVLVAEDALDAVALERFGAGRGALFTLAGRALEAGEGDPLDAAGRGWALADLAHNLDSAEERFQAQALAAPLLDAATSQGWSRNGRALGAMAHLARRDLDLAPGEPAPIGAPGRLARLLWHRLSGR